MYLSEEQRAAIRNCLQKQKTKSCNDNTDKNKLSSSNTPEMRKISQLLFDARDGREVFTPF
jgi:hypothetical protein